MKHIIVYLILFFSFHLFGQKFAVADNDTYDVVESVSFKIYNDNQLVYEGVTKNNKATEIPSDIKYDKIEFIKSDYKPHFIETENLYGAVFLTKEHVQLDDVVISSKKSDHIVLGESNRIKHSKSVAIISGIGYGIIFKNYKSNLTINSTTFYVDKVKHKTAYKIHFFEVEESMARGNLQTLDFHKKIYSSHTLYLNPKQKNRIEIEHQEGILFNENTKLFVWFELLHYLDENNHELQPEKKDRTMLKFQLSDENNYYAKTFNRDTSKNSFFLKNTNLRIKHDFAYTFFKTPHKSILLAPAVMLNTIKAEP